MESVPDRNDVAADVEAAPHANGIGPATGPTRKRKLRRRLWLGALVVFLGAWAIALTYSVTAAAKSPERLNTADARVTETACVDAQRELTALPQVGLHATIDERSTRVSSEDAILTTMINQIRTLHPQSSAPKIALAAWLDDWQRLVTARQNYADDLHRLGSNARFVEPASAGIEPIADKMNDWILEQGTRTDACNTGQLQGEVVEGPRTYGTESNS
jgi:hypothetical protein